jgi:uncharacterized protein (DUF2141 family)
MSKLMSSIAVAAVALAAQPTAAGAAIGPDAASCRPGSNGPALLVSVTGFKSRSGRVRVQVYNASNFLMKGQRVRRVDLPVTAPTMPVCVALPGPGTYAVAVRHDVDGDNAKRDWDDGGGFSRNPKITLVDLKPSFSEVAVPVGKGVRSVSVTLNYRRGLSIGPVRS